jgi:hypothetical protein
VLQTITIDPTSGYPIPFIPGSDAAGGSTFGSGDTVQWDNPTSQQLIIHFITAQGDISGSGNDYPFTGQPGPIPVGAFSQSLTFQLKPGVMKHKRYNYRVYCALARRPGNINFPDPPSMPTDGPAVVVNGNLGKD